MKHWESFMTSINIRLRVAKLRFNQILEYSVHCITLAKERKEGKNNYRIMFLQYHELCLVCQHFISILFVGHLPCQ